LLRAIPMKCKNHADDGSPKRLIATWISSSLIGRSYLPLTMEITNEWFSSRRVLQR